MGCLCPPGERLGRDGSDAVREMALQIKKLERRSGSRFHAGRQFRAPLCRSFPVEQQAGQAVDESCASVTICFTQFHGCTGTRTVPLCTERPAEALKAFTFFYSTRPDALQQLWACDYRPLIQYRPMKSTYFLEKDTPNRSGTSLMPRGRSWGVWPRAWRPFCAAREADVHPYSMKAICGGH